MQHLFLFQGEIDDDLKPKTIDESSVLEDGEKTLPLQVKSSSINQVKEYVHIRYSQDLILSEMY